MGVAPNGLVCYLFSLYHENLLNKIANKIINIKEVTDICDIRHDVELQEMTYELTWRDLGILKNNFKFLEKITNYASI
jgi:hypothetical protein